MGDRDYPGCPVFRLALNHYLRRLRRHGLSFKRGRISKDECVRRMDVAWMKLLGPFSPKAAAHASTPARPAGENP